jgi:hypothetical protein
MLAATPLRSVEARWALPSVGSLLCTVLPEQLSADSGYLCKEDTPGRFSDKLLVLLGHLVLPPRRIPRGTERPSSESDRVVLGSTGGPNLCRAASEFNGLANLRSFVPHERQRVSVLESEYEINKGLGWTADAYRQDRSHVEGEGRSV